MDGFKNSTRVQYMKGGSCEGYKSGGSVKGAAKISKVMGEFKRGELHSGSKKGPEVTSKKQAMAIALSEAGKKPVKKARGGMIEEGISTRPVDAKGRRMRMDTVPVDNSPVPPKKGIGVIDAMIMAAKRANKAVPAHRGKPMIERKAGGLACMPKKK
jgi:hypothetical protein